jgi:3-methylcrotonyl-CoA carboxylase alpha subunit
MEMNTRLQVEHPVTEMITGVDLVAWQIRIACGADLSQELLPQIRGHSLEIRVYAEQTIKNFLPMAGYCTHITWPQGYNIRIDSALDREGVMSPYFDPMIAKIIVWGHTREEARQRMIYALSSTMILGIHHNLDILGRILKHQDFIDVKHHTQWIEHTLLPEIIEEKRNVSSAYLAVAAVLFYKDSSEHLLSHFCHWRMFGEGTSYVYCKDDEDTHYRIAISQLDHHAWVCSDNQNMIEHHVVYHPSRNSFSLDDQPNEIHAVLSNDTLWINGCHIPISMLHHDECRESSPQDFNHENRFRSPMPGKVIRHMVSPQQHVQENTPLVILEAMKMEHTLCSPTSGYVHEFYACPGEQVEEGYIILKFIADEVDVIHPRERSEA